MAKFFLHRFERMREGGYEKNNISYDDFFVYVVDYLKINKDRLNIDEIIVVKFEDFEKNDDDYALERLTDIDVRVETYGYGWYRDDHDVQWFKKWNSGNQVVDDNGEPIKLYRGTDDGHMGSGFFSTEKSFSEGFGEYVGEYAISLKNQFDSLNEEHISLLIDEFGYIEDPFDGERYETAEDFINNVGSDTWSAIENYVDDIKGLGFDGIKIYEGGCLNYCVFDVNESVVDWHKLCFLLESKEGVEWCLGGREHHTENDVLVIPDFIKELAGERVYLAGCFEGECINDMETVLSRLGNIDYERLDGLIIGSGVEYEKSLFLKFKEKFDDIFVDESLDNVFSFMSDSDIVSMHNKILSFMIINNVEIDEILEYFDDDDYLVLEWLEKIKELKDSGLDFTAAGFMDNLKIDMVTSLNGYYYHGTALSGMDELLSFEYLDTSYSHLGVVYVSDSPSAVDFFAKSKLDEYNDMAIIFKLELNIDNLFKINQDGYGCFFVDGREYHVSDDREEYMEHLRQLGYAGVFLGNNYGSHPDIALFRDIMIDSDTEVSILGKNEVWSEFKKINLLKKQRENSDKRTPKRT